MNMEVSASNSWNQFELSENEDETLGNSFFTVGLFKVSNNEKSTNNPRVTACLQNNKILVAVDNSLIFLEDKDGKDCQFLNFSAEIDCFAVTQSGDVMICCLSDGNIHGVHIKGIPIFNLMINEADINNKGSFIDIIQLDEDFVVMCTNGKVYKIRNIDEKKFNEAAVMTDNEDTVEFNESLLNSAKLDKVASSKLSSSVMAFCCVKTFEGEIYIACGADSIFFVMSNHVERIKYPQNITRIKKLFNLENFVLGLTDNGDFAEICPYTMTVCVVKKSSEMIEDLRVLESNDDCNELLVLTKDEQNSQTMKIVDFPSMLCKTELGLSGSSWLVSQPKTAVNMYYISGTKNDNNFIQTIEVKSIIETDPEERFKKLLLRGHFDEAEDFAKQSELSLELLYEAKVKKSLMKLQSMTSASSGLRKTFNELIEHLEKIEDKNFLVTIRFSEIPDRTSMTEFLGYLLSNIDTNLYQNETNEINELLLRLETLRLIDPDECNLEWLEFLYHENMARIAMDFFKTDILTSCLIFSRHSSSIMTSLNLEKFHKWLLNIPTTTEPFQLIQWLKHFLPCYLQLFPNEMTHLVDWCLERTRALQFSSSWPEIGLEFINNINSIFIDIKFLCIDIRRSYHHNMDKIQNLIFTLEEMSVLKKTYHLTMTLNDYSKHSIEETAFRLLQRIQMHNLKRMVYDFLYPIFIERGGSPEETIVKYIQFLCTNKNLGYWQERAVASIELLHNEDNRLNSALLVLKVSPVPWSNIVLPLAKLGSSNSHPIAKAIYIEHKTQAIKIIKVKYDWPVDYFDLQQDRVKLVFRILKVDKPEMIEDVKTLIKSSPDIAREACYHLLLHLAEKGRIDEFMQLTANLEDENCSHCELLFEQVCNTFVRILDQNEFEDKIHADNLMECAKLLVNRLKNLRFDFKAVFYELRLKKLQQIIRVREEFKITLTLETLTTEKFLKFDEGNQHIINEVIADCSLDKMWSKMNLLVETLSFDRYHGYKLMCEKLNNLYVTCRVIEVLNSHIDDIEKSEISNAVDLAVLAISQQIKFFENKLNFEHYDPLTFPLVYEFLVKTLVHYDIIHHEFTLELLKLLQIGRLYYPYDVIEATKQERVMNSKVFNSAAPKVHEKKEKRRETFSLFEEFDKIVAVKEHKANEHLNPVLHCVCNSLKILIFILNIPSYEKFRCYLEKHEDVAQMKNDFFGSLENNLKLKQHKSVVKIMQMVIEKQEQVANNPIIPAIFVTSVNKKISKFLLSQKDPDYIFAFKILRSEINRDVCIDYLRSVLTNTSQKIAFSTFCEMYSNYIGNMNSVTDERQNRLKFYYYSELCKYDPSLRFKTNFDNMSINDLLKDLQHRPLNVELVKKLSKDFGWDYQKALIQQIKILLTNYELDFELRANEFGIDEVVVKTSVEMIRKKCAPYYNEIINMPLLAQEMQSFIKKINFYFYEMYLAVIDIIEQCKELPIEQKIQRQILTLLKLKLTGKRRRAEQTEAENWSTIQPDNSLLPSISKYRLPFKPMMESLPETYINEDLGVDTFEKFCTLISLHASHGKLDVEERLEICAMKAIKNSIMELKSKTEGAGRTEWNLKPTNNAFLQQTLRMVSRLKHKQKQLAILYFNVSHSPEGSDQVEAAYECWKFAIAHEQELLAKEKYSDVVERIKRKYPLLKTQHLLHLYGLIDEKLMQLVENPASLIDSLYHHDSILQPQKKDINKLCDELAQLYGVDLFSLQVKLIQKWLAFAHNASMEEGDHLNETVYEDFIGSSEDNVYVSDENVIRAHYILSSWKKDFAIDFVASELGANLSNSDIQLQLYECFAKLVDPQSDLDMIDPDKYLLIKSSHYLKQFGIHVTPEKFKTMDKVDVLKKIWASHYTSTKGLEVMSFICLGFNVHLAQIWNGLLKQMVSLKMVQHLSILVEILSAHSKLLHLSNLKLAWECVIKEPLIHATKNRTYENDLKMSKAFILLQKCPISTFLNLEEFIEQCLRLELPHMAAVFLAFSNNTNREKYVKMLQQHDNQELKKNIVELEEMGVAPVITKSACNILHL